jgi:hypothetical protein
MRKEDEALIVPDCIFRVKGVGILFQEGLDRSGEYVTFDLTKAAYIWLQPNQKGEMMVMHTKGSASYQLLWGTRLRVHRDDVIAQNTINADLIRNLRKAVSGIEIANVGRG